MISDTGGVWVNASHTSLSVLYIEAYPYCGDWVINILRRKPDSPVPSVTGDHCVPRTRMPHSSSSDRNRTGEDSVG